MEEQIRPIGLMFQQRTLKAGSSYTKDVVASSLKEFKAIFQGYQKLWKSSDISIEILQQA